MMSFWMLIKKIRKRTEQEKTFWKWQRRLRAFMSRSFMMSHIMKTAH